MSWINSCFERSPRSRWRLPYLPYRVYSLHVAILIADHEHRDQDSLVLAISLLIFRPSFLIIVEPKEKFRALFDNFNNRQQPSFKWTRFRLQSLVNSLRFSTIYRQNIWNEDPVPVRACECFAFFRVPCLVGHVFYSCQCGPDDFPPRCLEQFARRRATCTPYVGTRETFWQPSPSPRNSYRQFIARETLRGHDL